MIDDVGCSRRHQCPQCDFSGQQNCGVWTSKYNCYILFMLFSELFAWAPFYSHGLTEVRTWIRPPLKLGHAWVITCFGFTWIHIQNYPCFMIRAWICTYTHVELRYVITHECMRQLVLMMTLLITVYKKVPRYFKINMSMHYFKKFLLCVESEDNS